MTSEGLGEMFEGDSADTCVRKFPLVSMGGRVDIFCKCSLNFKLQNKLYKLKSHSWSQSVTDLKPPAELANAVGLLRLTVIIW